MLPGTWYSPTSRRMEVYSLERVNQGFWLGVPSPAKGNRVNVYWILKAETPPPLSFSPTQLPQQGWPDFRKIERHLSGDSETIQEVHKSMGLREALQQQVHPNYLTHLKTNKTQMWAQYFQSPFYLLLLIMSRKQRITRYLINSSTLKIKTQTKRKRLLRRRNYAEIRKL